MYLGPEDRPLYAFLGFARSFVEKAPAFGALYD